MQTEKIVALTFDAKPDQGASLASRILEVGELIRTQDNRCTADPIFVVEQKRTYVGSEGYGESRLEWIDEDGNTADEKVAAHLERNYKASFVEPKKWRRLFVFDVWEFVTACFTEQGCKDYLARDGHNLKEPRIYAYGTYRNSEYQTIRNALSVAHPKEQDSERAGKWLPVDGCQDGDVWFALSCGHVVMGYKSGAMLDWEGGVDHDCCHDANAVKSTPVEPPEHPDCFAKPALAQQAPSQPSWLPGGWKLEDIGPQIHLSDAAGKWTAVTPDGGGSPMQAMVYRFMADMIRAEAPARQVDGIVYAWAVSGVGTPFYGEFAEADARAEAKRVGGRSKAFRLYTAPPAQAQQEAVVPEWRAIAQRCLESMEAAVRFRETGHGRPPEQACMQSINELRDMLAATPPQPEQADDWTRKEWCQRAEAVFLEAGDDQKFAQEQAEYLWRQQDWGDLEDPYLAAKEDVESRPAPKQEGIAAHWHTLYLQECQAHKDDMARLGSEIEGLEAEQACAGDEARFTKDVPVEQGWYWHWNGDAGCSPIPTSVLWSGTTQSCFVSMGQLGLTESVYCDKYGGYWMKMTEPWGAIEASMTVTQAAVAPTCTLWCIHIPGPDEFHAAPSKDAAEHMADKHNKAMSEYLDRHPDPHGHGPSRESVLAKVTEWPNGFDEHALEMVSFDWAAWGLTVVQGKDGQ